MNTTYEQLKDSFQSFFVNRNRSRNMPCPQFREGDYWVHSPVCNAGTEAIHYELIRQGSEFFIELHAETSCKSIPKWKELRDVLDGDKRHYLHYTYYSSNYWRSRNPVVGRDDVKNDLAYMAGIVEPVFANSTDVANLLPKYDSSSFESLPFQRNLKEVASMLDADTLHMPAVQRGKVWNAARIETLWDSIFRGFSIGALLCKRAGEKRVDLLDGQQRSNAIALAYDSFPPKQRAASILWIDVNPKDTVITNGQKKFAFCVTTPSQPWGYGDSSDETRNALLSAFQKRDAIEKLKRFSPNLTWHDEKEKPYPGELYPYNAGCAVPFSLLREFLESWVEIDNPECPSFNHFLDWCAEKKSVNLQVDKEDNHWWNWLKLVQDQNGLQNPKQWDAVISRSADGRVGRIKQLHSYCIPFLDAGDIGDDEIATYFTRIGRGGVRPSDEELAYSVLKSHLGDKFRNKIEEIHERYGLAQPSRIAHLAVRCFRSAKTGEGRTIFCSSPVLEEAIKMCRTVASTIGASEEAVESGGKEEFQKFVCDGGLDALLAKVEMAVFKAPYGLTHWHRTRYCQYNNGDIFLFLLLTIRDNLFDFDLLAATAELLYEKASHPTQTIRFILSEGLSEGLAHSMRETYYGSSRLWTPVLPAAVQKVVESAKSELESNESTSTIRKTASDTGIAELISTGYNSQQAYGMLLYSCQTEANGRFSYDKNSGVWAEDNCPWDYDHILPHSWIDRMSGEFSDICQWLKNSLGNLAPLSFEMNRSLSDKPRDRFYPYCEKPERESSAAQIQEDYCIDGNALEKMRAFANDKDAQHAFIVGTLCRLSELYKKWYYGLKFNELLTFQNEKWYVNAGIIRRRQMLETLTQRPDCSGFSLRYYSADGKRMPIGMIHETDTDWFVWDWASIFMEKGSYAIELSIDRQCRHYEVGIARLSIGDGVALDESAMDFASKHGHETWECPKDDPYWHLVHRGEIPNEMTDDEVVEMLIMQLAALCKYTP